MVVVSPKQYMEYKEAGNIPQGIQIQYGPQNVTPQSFDRTLDRMQHYRENIEQGRFVSSSRKKIKDFEKRIGRLNTAYDLSRGTTSNYLQNFVPENIKSSLLQDELFKKYQDDYYKAYTKYVLNRGSKNKEQYKEYYERYKTYIKAMGAGYSQDEARTFARQAERSEDRKWDIKRLEAAEEAAKAAPQVTQPQQTQYKDLTAGQKQYFEEVSATWGGKISPETLYEREQQIKATGKPYYEPPKDYGEVKIEPRTEEEKIEQLGPAGTFRGEGVVDAPPDPLKDIKGTDLLTGTPLPPDYATSTYGIERPSIKEQFLGAVEKVVDIVEPITSYEIIKETDPMPIPQKSTIMTEGMDVFGATPTTKTEAMTLAGFATAPVVITKDLGKALGGTVAGVGGVLGVETTKTIPEQVITLDSGTTVGFGMPDFDKSTDVSAIRIPEREEKTLLGAAEVIATYGPTVGAYIYAPATMLASEVAVGVEKYNKLDTAYNKALTDQYNIHKNTPLEEDYRHLTKKEFEDQYGKELKQQIKSGVLMEIGVPLTMLVGLGAFRGYKALTKPRGDTAVDIFAGQSVADDTIRTDAIFRAETKPLFGDPLVQRGRAVGTTKIVGSADDIVLGTTYTEGAIGTLSDDAFKLGMKADDIKGFTTFSESAAKKIPGLADDLGISASDDLFRGTTYMDDTAAQFFGGGKSVTIKDPITSITTFADDPLRIATVADDISISKIGGRVGTVTDDIIGAPFTKYKGTVISKTIKGGADDGVKFITGSGKKSSSQYLKSLYGVSDDAATAVLAKQSQQVASAISKAATPVIKGGAGLVSATTGAIGFVTSKTIPKTTQPAPIVAPQVKMETEIITAPGENMFADVATQTGKIDQIGILDSKMDSILKTDMNILTDTVPVVTQPTPIQQPSIIQKIVQTPAQKLKVQPIQTFPTTTIPTTITPPPVVGFGKGIPIIKPPKFSSRVTPKIKKRIRVPKKPAFMPQVRVKRKWKNVSRHPMTKADALSRSSYIVDRTVAASFRAKPIGKYKKVISARGNVKGYFAKNKAKFRQYQIRKGKKIPLPLGGIERRGKRIDTLGERKGLTAAKLIKQKKWMTKTKKRKGKKTKRKTNKIPFF